MKRPAEIHLYQLWATRFEFGAPCVLARVMQKQCAQQTKTVKKQLTRSFDTNIINRYKLADII